MQPLDIGVGETDQADQPKALGSLNGQFSDLADEIIGAIMKVLENDLKMLPDLKRQAQAKLDAFAKRAAVPIFTAVLVADKSSEPDKLAMRLPQRCAATLRRLRRSSARMHCASALPRG